MKAYSKVEMKRRYDGIERQYWDDKTELCLTYRTFDDIFCTINKKDFDVVMPMLRGMCKTNKITVLAANNKTKTIKGKKVYIFVVQDCNDISTPDPMGAVFDDGWFAVCGSIYAFKKEEHRDAVFKYITTGKK